MTKSRESFGRVFAVMGMPLRRRYNFLYREISRRVDGQTRKLDLGIRTRMCVYWQQQRGAVNVP